MKAKTEYKTEKAEKNEGETVGQKIRLGLRERESMCMGVCEREDVKRV